MDQKQKIETAKRLIKDESIMELLTEFMLNAEDKIDPKIILDKTDEEIGQITRAELVAEDKIKYRFGRIKNLAKVIN